MSNNLTALGLELDYREDRDKIISPAHVLVIAEGFDSDGDTTYVLMHTPGMSNVMAGGLVNFAKIWTDLNLMNTLVRSVSSEEE